MRSTILRELCAHRDEFVSGKQLAEKLGISRVAVWKHIEALKEEGYDILGISGRGYRIAGAYNVIIPEDIIESLSTSIIGRQLQVYRDVESTNRTARDLIREGKAGEGTVVVARRQSGGRGRRGRSWVSPPGGLWFSLINQPGLALQETALFSLVFAVGICRAIDKFLPGKAEIKWPNDIFLNGKKICGILLELSGELEQADYLISGIGINVNLQRSAFENEVRYTSTSLLEESGQYHELAAVLTAALTSLEHYYLLFMQEGFSPILDEFKSRCFHLGKNIRIAANNRILEGKSIDIDENGSLLLDTGFGIERLTTGDVALI
ncbi:MAG: biotin--[acetyl-CoA-carboxylase] ligase [Syntrophomonas sp.]